MSSFPYNDILYLSHYVSTRHPPMPMSDRAAQFSPFAALTGHSDAIHETERLTGERVELSEEAKILLDQKQQYLASLDRPELTVTYFVADTKKEGGAYVSTNGILKKIDPIERLLILVGGQAISLDDILEIESPELPEMF